MKKLSLLCILLLVLFSCKSQKDKLEDDKLNWDYEKHILEIQKIINKGKYKDAIVQIEDLMVKYPGTDVFQLRYLIGYNYYSLKEFDTAKGYFEGLIQSFNNTDLPQEEKAINQKFVTLSTIILEKIEEEENEEFDPYHAKEEIEQFKKKRRRPKKDPKKTREDRKLEGQVDHEKESEEDPPAEEETEAETYEESDTTEEPESTEESSENTASPEEEEKTTE